ncbi:MAG: UbiA family prenyltransferase [Nevskia sp.]|nr:UbiA family prenyltransferase [Nevskia sp.]
MHIAAPESRPEPPAAAGIAPAAVPSRPLVVDLDGSLIRTDLLHETANALLVARPFAFLRALLRAGGSRARLKAELGRAATLDPAALPYNQELLSWLIEQRRAGRRLVLATASDRVPAEQIAAHLGLFEQVLASDGVENLRGRAKRDALVARYGERGFDYVGDSVHDLEVWASAHTAHPANASAAVLRAMPQGTALGRAFPVDRQSPLVVWAQALRLYQWAKNLLLLVPLAAAHRLLVPGAALAALIGFLCFGLCASSVYLLNDLVDVQDDRRHRSKCRRPFASGRLTLVRGWLVMPLPLSLGLAAAFTLLPWQFGIMLLVYYCMTLAYSLRLKRMMMVDVITLALLYTVRVVAGGLATATPVSFWLLTFALFIFTSLALIKRYTELKEARSQGRKETLAGRGYDPSDLEMVASLGAAAGYLSVMVLALYIQDPASGQLYRHPAWLWPACPLLLYWVSRAWMLAYRGRMTDDPILYALRDRASLLTGALFLVVFALAR